MVEFTIDPEFRDLLPPLSEDEFSSLRNDIFKNGCRDKGVVWKESNILIDGHNRHEICQMCDATFEVIEMSFKSRDDVKLWMIRNQLARRNITDAKRVVLNLMLKPVLAAKAKETQGTRTDLCQNSDKGSEPLQKIDTLKDIAEASGVSRDTVQRVEKVMEEGDDATKSKMLSGEISVNKAYETVRPHVANNSGNNEWYTPAHIIESARTVMDVIRLDPASSDAANEIVKAMKYFTAETDGLKQKWTGNIWLNPPYSNPLIGQFIDAVVAKYQSREIHQACVLVNNASETEWCQKLLAASEAVCFPRGRIKFLDQTGTPANSPLQGQLIAYFGNATSKFIKEFSAHGVCFARCL